jgi:hypothetical protein
VTTILTERALRATVGLFVNSQWVDGYTVFTGRQTAEPAVAGFNHISVTNPDAYPLGNDQHMRAIESIGISRFPNTGFSYNGAVLPGGVLYEGQPWGRRGAHTVNTKRLRVCASTGCPSRDWSLDAPDWNNNVNGRALVFARNLDDAVTDADVDAAGRYWAGHKLCGLMRADARQHGHRCCADKDCPGNRVWVRMADISDATADYVRAGIEDDMPNSQTELVAAARIAVHGLLKEAAAAVAGAPEATATGRQVRTFLHAIIDPVAVDEEELAAALAGEPIPDP